MTIIAPHDADIMCEEYTQKIQTIFRYRLD